MPILSKAISIWKEIKSYAGIALFLIVLVVASNVLDAIARAVWNYTSDAISSFFGTPIAKKNATDVARYLESARKGDSDAQTMLGYLYGTGNGVPIDYQESANWYLRAANQGDLAAQSSIGFMYYSGQGIQKDYIQAYKWTAMVAAYGDKSADKNLSLIAIRMTPAQIAQAQELARKWKPTKPQ